METIKNLTHWLSPWVIWLDEKEKTASVAVTKIVIRDYMFSRITVKVGSSFNRIALAISAFSDHFGATAITAPRASHMPSKDLSL